MSIVDIVEVSSNEVVKKCRWHRGGERSMHACVHARSYENRRTNQTLCTLEQIESDRSACAFCASIFYSFYRLTNWSSHSLAPIPSSGRRVMKKNLVTAEESFKYFIHPWTTFSKYDLGCAKMEPFPELQTDYQNL